MSHKLWAKFMGNSIGKLCAENIIEIILNKMFTFFRVKRFVVWHLWLVLSCYIEIVIALLLFVRTGIPSIVLCENNENPFREIFRCLLFASIQFEFHLNPLTIIQQPVISIIHFSLSLSSMFRSIQKKKIQCFIHGKQNVSSTK